jgi:hypothetical protein
MKTKTREQVEVMKGKAARFARDVLEDEEKADDFDEMSVEEYAEHKGIAIANPGKEVARMPKPSLRQRIENLQEENDKLQETLEEYESRFDDIASSLPEAEDEEDQDEEAA